MGILHRRYFDCLRLLRSSDGKKNHEPRDSRRRRRVVYDNIPSLHQNLSRLSLIARDEDVFFFFLKLLSFLTI